MKKSATALTLAGIRRVRDAPRHPRSRPTWALVMCPCQRCRRAKTFSSRNRIAGPRHAPHRKLSAHRRPPIASTLRPPRRHVGRCAGPVRSLQLSLEMLPCDFTVPSGRILRSVALTLNRSPFPSHLQFAGSRSFRAKDRGAVRVTELVPRGRAFGEARFPEMIRTNVWQGSMRRESIPFGTCLLSQSAKIRA
ncbi:hypothetical protein SAMN05443247_00842 [Bradyrhizobium erythrophlei]|jgi:hypothetical protein|nr:hypothetical protein SAMN05443247_00842 [Bradyrhizobium erythrophlei]